jgi:hypothetical protein
LDTRSQVATRIENQVASSQQTTIITSYVHATQIIMWYKYMLRTKIPIKVTYLPYKYQKIDHDPIKSWPLQRASISMLELDATLRGIYLCCFAYPSFSHWLIAHPSTPTQNPQKHVYFLISMEKMAPMSFSKQSVIISFQV